MLHVLYDTILSFLPVFSMTSGVPHKKRWSFGQKVLEFWGKSAGVFTQNFGSFLTNLQVVGFQRVTKGAKSDFCSPNRLILFCQNFLRIYFVLYIFSRRFYGFCRLFVINSSFPPFIACIYVPGGHY